MKLFRIKHKTADLYWAYKGSALAVFTDTGAFFNKEELEAQLALFKYQRGLWPNGSTIVEYTVDDTKTKDSSFATDFFIECDKELVYETLKGRL
jgi:hypothetical protein